MTALEILKEQLPEIEKKLGYHFHQPKFLILAFVHSSYVNEYSDVVDVSNERLEFLGDAVLGVIVSDFLYQNLTDQAEGTLSHLRSRLVDASACSFYIEKLELENYILLGKGERKNFEMSKNSSIQADLFEAIVAAIYLDGGLEKVRTFLTTHFEEEFFKIMDDPIKNYKADLQDYTQKKYQKIPVYKVIEESGPDHNKTFKISVFIDDTNLGTGYGSSKKSAQQAAACEALKQINPADFLE